MFLRPHHFQQQTRYLEGLVESRSAALNRHGWGFSELSLDRQQLTLGKLSITKARGVFQDGTPFTIPEDYPPPAPLEVPENVRDATVFLGLPISRVGASEVSADSDPAILARYLPAEDEVRDTAAGSESIALVQVGRLRMRLLLEEQNREEYACLGIARIVECRADHQLVLDESFLPPVVDCHAAAALGGYLKELQGLLHQRGEALAGRVSEAGRGGAAEIADFLMLQAVNRYEPVFAHLATASSVHPELFYRLAVEMAGELSTFTARNKRPPGFEPYRHEDPRATFTPVIQALRQSLSMVLEQNVVSIPLEERRYGIRVAQVGDRSLLDSATFVLAVSAKMPIEELRKRFPAQAKIGSVEQIRQLVNVQLPGVQVRALPVAPRQLPYHTGFVYFELDRASEHWAQIKKSAGIALHVGGDFPGIVLEFWAIKGTT